MTDNRYVDGWDETQWHVIRTNEDQLVMYRVMDPRHPVMGDPSPSVSALSEFCELARDEDGNVQTFSDLQETLRIAAAWSNRQ